MKDTEEEEESTRALNETLVLEIAQEEGLDPLYEMLARTPSALDQIDKIPFIHTPLHEAVAQGNTYVALEILRLKPSLGRKLNANGESPLHLALDNTELAKRLIECDSELVRVQGREGITPLHHVARTGNTHLLAEFLCACPESITELTIRGENALHIAAKEGQRDAFTVIFEWIWRSYNSQLLSRKDEHGNTVLHIAVSHQQLEIVKLLVRRAPILKKEINSGGWRAVDIADDEEIKNMLLRHPIKPPHRKVRKDARNLDIFLLSPEPLFERVLRFILYCRRDLSLDMRNVVLVVAVLIATATFEAGGKLGEEKNNESDDQTKTTTVASNQVSDILNTVSFTFSIAVIALVLSSKPYTTYLHLSLVFMAITYGSSALISPWKTVPSVGLTVLIYALKNYFESMEREIWTEMPATWVGYQPRLQALHPAPVPLERLRMVYRLMRCRIKSSSSIITTTENN